MEEVVGQLQVLPASDQKKIYKLLRPKLMRALRQRTMTVEHVDPLSSEMLSRLEKLMQQGNALTRQETIKPALLAGYTVQMGDDRYDFSLSGRLQQWHVI